MMIEIFLPAVLRIIFAPGIDIFHSHTRTTHRTRGQLTLDAHTSNENFVLIYANSYARAISTREK